MAGNVGDSSRSLDGSLANEGSKDLGILAISLKQRPVDHLGSANWRICSDPFTGVPCFLEYQGNGEK